MHDFIQERDGVLEVGVANGLESIWESASAGPNPNYP
jgi:hypothetical protein